MAARILHWIGIWGDEDDEGRLLCNKRRLERALHAERLEEWTPAIEYLVKRNAIAITGRTVTVLDAACSQSLPDPHDPRGLKREKEARRKRRSKRPLSAWVKRKILERGGEIPLGR